MEYRAFTEDDCVDLNALMAKVWNRTAEIEYWKWKYIEPPFESKCYFVKNDNEQLVAFAGIWWRPTYFKSEVIQPGTILDVMSDPDHRSGKAFGQILDDIDNDIIRNKLILGIVNSLSYKAFNNKVFERIAIRDEIPVRNMLVSAGSYYLKNIHMKMVADFFSKNVMIKLLNLSSNKKIELERLQSPNKEIEEVWENSFKDYQWLQYKDKKFIKWRYFDCPTRAYQMWLARLDGQPLGYIVTTITDISGLKRGIIVDWLVSKTKPEIFKEMLICACGWLINSGANVIEIWLFDHESEWVRCTKKLLFKKAKVGRKLLLGGKIETSIPRKIRLSEIFATPGDTDYLGPKRN